MKRELKDTKAYQELCEELSRLLEKGQGEALRALSEVRNQIYWDMGKRLSRVKAMGEQGTASELLGSLARDLGVSRTNLYRALQFYHAYPKGLPDSPKMRTLPWAVHTELLPIKDIDKRGFYLQQAVDEGWSARVLRRAIRSNLYENELDRAQGRPAGRLELLPAHRFHYAAELLRVIDGDTIVVRIDLGFDTWRKETIRLRGIDTPEMDSKEGKAARQFVKKALAGFTFVFCFFVL